MGLIGGISAMNIWSISICPKLFNIHAYLFFLRKQKGNSKHILNRYTSLSLLDLHAVTERLDR